METFEMLSHFITLPSGELKNIPSLLTTISSKLLKASVFFFLVARRTTAHESITKEEERSSTSSGFFGCNSYGTPVLFEGRPFYELNRQVRKYQAGACTVVLRGPSYRLLINNPFQAPVGLWWNNRKRKKEEEGSSSITFSKRDGLLFLLGKGPYSTVL